MSQGLVRIRQVLSEIEEVQRQGQLWAQQLKAPVQPPPLHVPHPKHLKEVSPLDPATVSLTLTESVTLQVALPSGEDVRIRQLPETVEIAFADGKAFHIPFKTVA